MCIEMNLCTWYTEANLPAVGFAVNSGTSKNRGEEIERDKRITRI